MSTPTLAPLSSLAQQILSGFTLITQVQASQACVCGEKTCDLMLINADNVPFSLEVYTNQELDLYVLRHTNFSAVIANQGGHLLSWQPASQEHDCIFMSELDPYKSGVALRGGIPVCYPWFGKVANPAHGTARISIWGGQKCVVTATEVEFIQQFNNPTGPSASLSFKFSFDQLKIILDAQGLDQDTMVTVDGKQIPVTAALHTYFNISDINQVRTLGLPKGAISQILEKFPGITIDTSSNFAQEDCKAVQVWGFVDHICKFEEEDVKPVVHTIVDPVFNRKIEVMQEQATDCVFWNPWNTKVSALSDQAYKHMLCLETARICQGFTAQDHKLIGIYKVSKL